MQTKQRAVNQQENKLPAFNEVIKIEVEVQSIYEKLLATFPEDYKHKEILSHAIIGAANTHGGIGYIYNALSGFTNEIDFKVGDVVLCTEQERNEFIEGDDVMVRHRKTKSVEIGKCVIKEINLYKSDKILVEFTEAYNYDDSGTRTTTSWVSHKNCTKWANVQIVAQQQP